MINKDFYPTPKKNKKVFGIGVNDYNDFVCINGRAIKSYQCWKDMLRRCYDLKTAKPTYKDCKVCNEWLYFSNFKKWFDKYYRDGYELDKDILVKGNKIYSPDTCCLIPQRLNTLIVTHKRRRGEYPIGVSFYAKYKKFLACINKNKRNVHLGYFDNIDDAFNAYKKAKEEYIKELSDFFYNNGYISKDLRDKICMYVVSNTD